MKTRHFPIAVATILLLVSSIAMAQGNPCNPCSKGMMDKHHFKVDDPMKRNSVTFKSEAPLEDIVGTTNEITGYLAFDPANPEKGGHGELTVPVASINTGIPLRDEHLQSSDWLDAGKHPHIKLTIKELRDIRKVSSSGDYQTYDVTVVGDLSLHGQTKAVSIPGRMTYLKESEETKARMPGDLIAARASFDIKLADFNVTGPSGSGLIGSKVGKTIAIDVSIMGSNAMGTMAGAAGNPCGDKAAMNPCNPCGGKAMNPCNPCGGKTPAMNPCNPCNK